MSKYVDLTTDAAWEEWGRRDPYYGVITDPKFRRSAINEDSRREFFESGQSHADHILATIRKHIDPEFAPKKVLDFGCGVGRLLIPFAAIADRVVGVDVSPSMLEEARRNCQQRQLHNVKLLQSDDSLSCITDAFDLIHSCIVFQHIPAERGRSILGGLLRHMRPGGAGAIQLTYSKSWFASTHGVAPRDFVSGGFTQQSPISADPEIQMNPYNLNEIFFLMQGRGIERFHGEFTDHGGELGLFLFFKVASATDSAA